MSESCTVAILPSMIAGVGTGCACSRLSFGSFSTMLGPRHAEQDSIGRPLGSLDNEGAGTRNRGIARLDTGLDAQRTTRADRGLQVRTFAGDAPRAVEVVADEDPSKACLACRLRGKTSPTAGRLIATLGAGLSEAPHGISTSRPHTHASALRGSRAAAPVTKRAIMVRERPIGRSPPELAE